MSPKWIKGLLKPVARPILGSLGWLEDKLLPDYQLRYSPVFIVGPPRSGTTLLTQLVNHALATSYFTNLAARLQVQGICRPPVVFSAWLARLLNLLDLHRETFKSHHGHTRGWGSPIDGALIWLHWVPDSYAEEMGELSQEAQRAIYQIVAGTERVFGRPFVDKSVYHSNRIPALAEIFPTALFIRNVRNPLAVAQSLYIARTRINNEWFSIKPKEFGQLKDTSIIEQVCGQVYFLEQSIAEGLKVVSSKRILAVDYKDVCLNPQREVDKIADFMNRHGAATEQIRSLPAKFPFSHTRRVDIATYRSLIDHLQRLYGYEMTRLDEPS